MIDYIFRELAVNYLGRNDLAHVDPDTEEGSNSPKNVVKRFVSDSDADDDLDYPGELLIDRDRTKEDGLKQRSSISLAPQGSKQIYVSDESAGLKFKVKQAIESGYTGDVCTDCQSMTMVHNGTCLKCMTCGTTTGCS